MKNHTQHILMQNELISIGETNFSPPLSHPLQLSYTSLFICLEGSAVVSVNFKNYLLKTNDILVLAEDSIARILRTTPNLKVFYCLLNRAFAAEVAYNLPNPLFLFLNEYPLCRPTNTNIPLLQMWLQQTRHIIQYCHTHWHIMLRNHLQNIFLKITEEIPPEGTLPRYKRNRQEILCWQFWEMIGKYSTTQRNVAFYAQKLNITPFYLSQITKKYLNDSPKDLIDRQVVLELKAMLTSTDLSIKEIAERLNFEDTSYMARYFKRHAGSTLTAYRK